LDGDAVARDPGALADEVYAISMFGGSRAVWIEAQARDLLPALEPLFERPPQERNISAATTICWPASHSAITSCWMT
ncbi:MAG: DNA polymerase III subunit delta, partial [Limisphaerales bacterium]